MEIFAFPGGSDSKESTCSVGEAGLIPGSGRFPEEESGHPLQYYKLRAQTNKPIHVEISLSPSFKFCKDRSIPKQL